LDNPRPSDATESLLDDAPAVPDPSVKDIGNVVLGSRSPTPTVGEGGRIETQGRGPLTDGPEKLVVQADSDADDIVETVRNREKIRVKTSKRSHKSDVNADSDSDGPAARSRKKGAKGVPHVVYDSDDSDNRPSSRHKPVSGSAIYSMYEGQVLSDVRRRFQTLIFVRDGSPPKTLTIHRHMNYKLALIAAKDVMDGRLYKEFKNAMEIAYKDTTKE
jgi:hypothetical protein